MAAIANGIAVGRFFRVFCSTYLVFSDYMRPSIRLAAMMKLPTIYVFTHDSVFLGEDGPTHQPVEQLASCVRSRICWCCGRATQKKRPRHGRWPFQGKTVLPR